MSSEGFNRGLLPAGPWHSWDADLDFCSRLDDTELENIRRILWRKHNFLAKEWNVIKYASEGDENVVAFALFCAGDANCLMNVRDERHATLLHVLASVPCTSALMRLAITKNPLCLSTCDAFGNTPFHIAAVGGNHRLLRVMTSDLLPHEEGAQFYVPPKCSLPGPGINERNNEGWTPLHLTVNNDPGHRQTLCVSILSSGLDFNLNRRRAGDGYTAVHIAVSTRNSKCLKHLLLLGASPVVPNDRGLTALELAHRLGVGEEIMIICEQNTRFLMTYRSRNTNRRYYDNELLWVGGGRGSTGESGYDSGSSDNDDN